ncbi:Phosphoglucosamine mutase [hydrothermal vent metagenome]|uniref:Phosphoglucosamine mutase n=1 Tax=hydrothermal vent metagenome TaxID=652676 RepID=A0A3B1D497_9ZZZZ
MGQKIQKNIKFGTDGWRGVISDNFTFENVAIVAQAISEWIKKDFELQEGKPNIVAVGYDARFLSQEYAEIVSCVLVANNIKVYLSNNMIPTPALSYGVVDVKGVAGVMITASHNPGKFNGIKIKTYQGGGASNDITDKVEAYLEKVEVQTINLKQAKKEQKIIMYDFNDAYLKFMKSYVDLTKIKESKFKVIQDIMHGSGGGILEDVLKGSQIDLEYMRNSINPSFGGVKPEPVEEYLEDILKRMKTEDFDLGLVLDGDADRISAIAPGGEFINPQKILGLLILHLVRNRGFKGGIIKTICGTELIDNIANKLNLKLYETPVGFKYISDLMVSEEIIAGGEEAGGMGVQGYIPERDGNLSGLLLLEMMVYQKKNMKQILEEMEAEFGRYYYERAGLELGDSKFDPKRTAAVKTLLGEKVIEVKDFDGVKLICEDRSWLMLRPSGTEPLVRAYSEAKSLQKAKELIECGKKLLK